MLKRWSNPFPDVLVPVFPESNPQDALTLACQLNCNVHLLGFVQVEGGLPLSRGNAGVRALRKQLTQLAEKHQIKEQFHVSVSYDPWDDLRDTVLGLKPGLVIMDWKAFAANPSPDKNDVLTGLAANLAVVSGALPEKLGRSLVLLRGGPHAQLALRLALALPKHNISALHLASAPETVGYPSDPFRGLAHILPSLPEVHYENRYSPDPLMEIREEAKTASVLVLGASVRAASSGPLIGSMAAGLIERSPIPVILVKSQRPEPQVFTGPEAERSGIGAISILVDKWFAENTFHAAEFDRVRDLARRKKEQKLTISLALPALNEEKTVGTVIETIQKALMAKVPLLDEIVLIDSNSKDHTREIARSLGVPVYIHQELLPQYGARTGKGEALWKSLYVTSGDILVWIDSDIVNIHPRFVYGVLGPMLLNPEIQFVKGFYQRPLRTGRKLLASAGGGRVTELTARPLINLFYPELSGVIQPLSGEYGGRRSALERLSFTSGYGVETSLLIDAYEKFGLRAIAQVDLLERIHHNQSLQALSMMSFVIMQTLFHKLEGRLQRPLLEEVNKSMKMIEYLNGSYYLNVQELVEMERPPMIDLPEYRERGAVTGASH